MGGGHAGCGRAHRGARLGRRNGAAHRERGDIARINVQSRDRRDREGPHGARIDALGGLMGRRVTDRAGIQFKMLNRGRGLAVWSPRASATSSFSDEMLALLDGVTGLDIVEGVARRALLEGGRVAGLELMDGRRLGCDALVITPGTFLNGLIHIGDRQLEGGRIGEHAARALSECPASWGSKRGRLKTGTPPRLHRDSIDWSALEEAPATSGPSRSRTGRASWWSSRRSAG